MAFQRANPRPFTPWGFHPLQFQHREFMARAVVNRSPAQHEDWAIVSFSPLPDFPLHFGLVNEIIHEFLGEHKQIEVREVVTSHVSNPHD
jgi:hypothetical protein